MSGLENFDNAVRLHRQGQLQEAETLYRDVLKRQPNCADAVINLAAILEKLGRSEEAISLYESVIANGHGIEFNVNLGALLISAKRPHGAIAPLQKAIELAPGCVPALVNLAGAHSMLGNHAEALASVRKVIQLKPEDVGVLQRCAALLKKLGHAAEAVAMYERAMGLTQPLPLSRKARGD